MNQRVTQKLVRRLFNGNFKVGKTFQEVELSKITKPVFQIDNIFCNIRKCQDDSSYFKNKNEIVSAFLKGQWRIHLQKSC